MRGSIIILLVHAKTVLQLLTSYNTGWYGIPEYL